MRTVGALAVDAAALLVASWAWILLLIGATVNAYSFWSTFLGCLALSIVLWLILRYAKVNFGSLSRACSVWALLRRALVANFFAGVSVAFALYAAVGVGDAYRFALFWLVGNLLCSSALARYADAVEGFDFEDEPDDHSGEDQGSEKRVGE